MKRLLLILTLVCFAISGWAEQITREQALRQAQQFLSKNGKGALLTTAETSMSKARRRSQQVPDYYYVFNAGQDQGYVIVSGDDRTEPILGYSYHGTFDVDKIPCNMAAWLQGYADQIKYIQEHPEVQVTRGDVPIHATVPDMITTKWNQTSPYNDLLPEYGGKKCVTGCGPTAMAQIMNYYGAPTSTLQDIPAYTTSQHGISCESLPVTTFNWGNMESDNAEVAKLMKYCAYAVQADFDPDGTSSSTNIICNAFTHYFGYGNGIVTAFSQFYSDVEWDQMIYSELANGRPVFYSGQNAKNEGHFFILHGYNAGYYTVNWGWGSLDDGQFLLNAMNPASMGSGNGFNYTQAAILCISPNNVRAAEEPILTAEDVYVGPTGANPQASSSTEFVGTRDGSGNVQFALYLSYWSSLLYSYTFDVGYALMQDGAIVGSVYSFFTNMPFNTGNIRGGYSYPITFGAGLANGDYQIKLASKEASSEWKICKEADNHVINVRVTDTSITLKVGALSPTPEVTQEELDELAALYAAQKTAINEKLSTLTANETKMKTLASTLSEIYTAIGNIDTKISAIESKLNSEYLTAEQKQTYKNQLDELKVKRTTQATAYNSAVGDLETLKSASSTLKTALNNLQTQVNTGAAAVASITTKADLDASTASVANIKTQQESNNVDAETTKISALETTVAAISVTDIQTSLSALESVIDTAIAAAKEASDEEAKAKLEEGKKALEEACDKMTAKLSEKQEVVAANEKKILNLEAQIKDYYGFVAEVEKYIDAIKEKLNSDMLTAEQKADFESKVETFEKGKSTFDKAVKDLSDALALASKENDQLKSTLNEIDAQIKDLQSAINAITTTDALNKAKEDADKVEAQLSNVSAADVEKQLLSVQDNLGKLSLDGTTKELAALEEEVEKAIADGKEAYEKQQAEKLAKAKEAFEAAVAALEEAIQSQEANYENRLNVVSTLKATLVELDDVISQMKAKCAEIEKKLQELIDKQSTTRADDSEIIEELKKKLTELKKHIETLESQREVIPGQIDQLDQQMKSYAAVIEEAKTAKQKLQADLSSATTADEVEKLSASVANAKSELASEGLDWYNTLVYNCNIVVEYVSGFADNVNIVEKETQVLEKAVEETVTAINQLIIDESKVVARYDMKGNPVDSTYKGVQIIKLKNGKTIKLNVK